MSDSEIEISFEEYETSDPKLDAVSNSTGDDEGLSVDQAPAPLAIDWDNLPELPSLELGADRLEATKPQATSAQAPETIPFWTEQVEQYERELEGTEKVQQRAAICLEIGRISDEHLGNKKKAAAYYQKAFALDKTNLSVIHAARRLFTEVNKLELVVKLIQAEIDCSAHPATRAILIAEKAALLQNMLEKPEDAQAEYLNALEVWAAEPLAIQSLEQMHSRQGQFVQLHTVYRRAIAVAQTNEQKLSLYVAAAQLAESHLPELAVAIEHYEAILTLEPSHPLALAALRRLYGPVGRWEDLIRVLVQSAELADSSQQAEAYLVSAARVEADKCKAVDRALVLMLQALQYAPDDVALLREIEWLYEETGKFEDVVKVLQLQSELLKESDERALVLFRLATVLEEKLEKVDEAILLYQEVLQLSPAYEPATQALGRLLESREQWEPLAQLFGTEIAQTTDDAAKVVRLFKLAKLYADKLEKGDEAIRCLLELLATKPNYGPAIRMLEFLYQKYDRVADLVELYRLESRHVSTASQRIRILLRVGQLCEMRLQALSQAVAAYEEVLEIDSTVAEALDGSLRIYEQSEQWAKLVRIIDLKLGQTEKKDEVSGLLQLKAVCFEKHLDQPDEAISAYEQILADTPNYLPALINLGQLYKSQGRFESLTAMFRREIDQTQSLEHKVSLLFRLAEILTDRVGDDERGMELFEQILEFRPDSWAALNAMQLIAGRQGDYDRLEKVLTLEAERTDDERERAKLLQSVAEICEFELERPDRAAEILQEILRLGYGLETAIEGLVRIFSAAGLWSALALALRTAAEHAKELQSKVAILARLAEVYAEKLDKSDEAIAALEEALALDGDETSVLKQLERLFARREDWRQVVDVSERLCAIETDPKNFAARKIRMASILEHKLNDGLAALECMYQVLQKVPTHPVPLRRLEVICRRAGDWSSLLQFYHREAMVATNPYRRADLLFRAGDIAEYRLEDTTQAYSFYLKALEFQAYHMPSIRACHRLAMGRGDSSKALELLRREGETTTDVGRSLELLVEAGRIYREELKDVVKATETFLLVLDRSPGHDYAADQLGQIYRESGDWDGVVGLLENQGQGEGDVKRKAEFWRAAANAAQDKLSDRERAASLYQRVLELEPEDLGSLTRLGPILLKLSRFEDALSVFQKIVSLSTDASSLAFAYRTLGMIYEEVQEDLVLAVQAYQAAYTADPNDDASLKRLSDLYINAEDWASAINVMLRLNEAETNERERAGRFVELASLYHKELNDFENARLALLRARDLEPTNLSANLGLIEIFEKQENWNALTDAATKYFEVLPPEQAAEAVPLRIKTARLYLEHAKNEAGALLSLDHALAIEPYNQEALELYASVAAKREELFAQAIEAHRRLLRLNPFNVDSYHEMRRMYEHLGAHDKAFVLCELLIFLRAEYPEEDMFFSEFAEKVAPHALGSLTSEEHESWVVHHGEQGPARALMEILSPELGNVFPEHFQEYELNPKSDRSSGRSEAAVREIVEEARDVFVCPETAVWVAPQLESEVFIESAEPLAVIVGPQFDRRTRENEKRFVLSQRVQGLKGGHQIFHRCSFEVIEALIKAAASLAEIPVAGSEEEAVLEWTKKLKASLSRKALKALKDYGSSVDEFEFDVSAYLSSAVHTRNRAAMIITNNVQTAIKLVARENEIRAVFADTTAAEEALGQSVIIRELMAFIISEQYFSARQKLGFSIQSVH